jgi:hypothetical protein
MPLGQFWTVFTFGFAAAIASIGITGAVTFLFWHTPFWHVAWALDGYVNWLSPLYFSLIVAGATLLAAYWIVRIQQSIVHWAANRAIARLERDYSEVARLQGADEAEQFLRQKASDMLEGRGVTRFDLSAGRNYCEHSPRTAFASR